ncbi:MAG: 50S ribosomal protein L18 [bacterium]
MEKVKRYKNLIDKRKVRIRSKIEGSSSKPRITVFRSNKYIYGQAVDDSKSQTLVSGFGSKKESFDIGEKFGTELLKKKIKKAVFDRNGYKYHGVVKNFADGVRKGGVQI